MAEVGRRTARRSAFEGDEGRTRLREHIRQILLGVGKPTEVSAPRCDRDSRGSRAYSARGEAFGHA